MTIPNLGWVGVGVLAGVVIAGMALAPSMASINDGLTCLTGNCTDDLAAQRSMAVAAWAMLGVTLLSLLLAVGTVVLVYSTYQATRRGVEVADRQAGIAEDMGRRQVRAYLSVTGATMDLERFPPSAIILTLTNTGRSPARNIRVRLELTISTNVGRRATIVPLSTEVGYFAPEIVEPLELHFTADFPEFDPMALARAHLEGRILYEDVFGQQDEIVVSYRRTKVQFTDALHELYRSDTRRSL